MNSNLAKPARIERVEVAKTYGSSVLLAARHFSFVRSDMKTLDLADSLRGNEEVEAVAVLDDRERPLGMVTRDGLFSLLAKPFGREVLGRTLVSEVMEGAPFADAHMSLFAVANAARAGDTPWLILVDGAIDSGGDGENGGMGTRFRGLLSLRDLSDYLSHITEEDIELAGSIQARLEESNEEIEGAGFGIVAWSRAAKGVGGDFWFSKRLDDGRVFLCLCDVSGKGVAASLVVSMVWGMLTMYDFMRGLDELLITLNESLISTFRLERYLTGFFAIYDGKGRELAVADMGHSHSLLVRGGRPHRLKNHDRNLPLGIEAALEPKTERWRLEAGDSLFVYSDGLTEQEDRDGREFGEARLAAVLSESLAGALPRGEAAVYGGLREAIPRALDIYRGRIPQQDDMSFLCLEVSS